MNFERLVYLCQEAVINLCASELGELQQMTESSGVEVANDGITLSGAHVAALWRKS